MIFFVDVPLPGVVHSDVTARTLQQLFLCLSPAGHCHGCEDAAHHPVLRHAQRQTGNSSENANVVNTIIIIIIKIFIPPVSPLHHHHRLAHKEIFFSALSQCMLLKEP